MAIVNKNNIKEWFRTLKKPTEAQFHAWVDSYRHKWEKVPLDDVDGLSTAMSKKADLVNGLVPAHQLPFSITSSEVISLGNITATANSVTVEVHSSGSNRVRVDGVIYERKFPNSFSFTPVVNYTKILIIYAMPDPALFFLAEGAEALQAIEPELPEGALVIRRIVVSTDDQSIDPELATGFREKIIDGWNGVYINGDNVLINITNYGLRYRVFGSSNHRILGFINYTTNVLYDGLPLSIKNDTNSDLVFSNASAIYYSDPRYIGFTASDLPFSVKKGETANFAWRSSTKSFEIIKTGGGGAEFPDGNEGDVLVKGATEWQASSRLTDVENEVDAEIVNRSAADLAEKNERVAADNNLQGQITANTNAIGGKVDKPTTDGTLMLQKVGSVFTWVAGVVQNIANTDLTNLSARIFTQGNTFTWNTAGFFHYLKGLLDKTGNGTYTKVVVVHPTTGEMVTRDFADPAATTLAIQNANSTQKTNMRVALLGTSVPASPVINVASLSFIKREVRTTIFLSGINLTPLEPISIWIEDALGAKIYAENFYAISGVALQTTWYIPSNFELGTYKVNIQNGATAQGASQGYITVGDSTSIISLNFNSNNSTIRQRIGFALIQNTTAIVGENIFTTQVRSTNYSNSAVDNTVDASIKTDNVFLGTASWEIVLDNFDLINTGVSSNITNNHIFFTATTNNEFTDPSTLQVNANILTDQGWKVQLRPSNASQNFNVPFRIVVKKTGNSLITYYINENGVITGYGQQIIDTTLNYALAFQAGRNITADLKRQWTINAKVIY